jgi:formylglycine-generating enzyme required for sulfatase activity
MKAVLRTCFVALAVLGLAGCPGLLGPKPTTLSTDARLSAISLSDGNLAPVFAAGTTNYAVALPYASATVTVGATKADAKAKLVISMAQPMALAVGENVVTLTVTAEDGKTKRTYALTLTRAAANADASLASLGVSVGALDPAFDPATLDYTLAAGAADASITLTAAAAGLGATVAYDPGATVALASGTNVAHIDVTAQDGTTTRRYTVTVEKAGGYLSPNIGELVYVPAGSFQRDATPENISAVSAFRMAKYEITRAQYVAVTGKPDPSDPAMAEGNSPDCPVQQVGWYDAVAFCNQLSVKEGLSPVYSCEGLTDPSLWPDISYDPATIGSDPEALQLLLANMALLDGIAANWDANGYRLPTEMEWLWAAMGTDLAAPGAVNTTGYLKPFAGSDGTNDPADYMHSRGATSENPIPPMKPVGSLLPNELAIFDLSGNAAEWCWDWMDGWDGDVTAFHTSGLVVDHRGGTKESATYQGVAFRMLRGGSIAVVYSSCALNRRDAQPGTTMYSDLGIRVVRR